LVNQRANFQLAAITLGLILLGGTILGSAPFAFADHDNDSNEELKAKLKELIEKIETKVKVEKLPPRCDEPPCGRGDGDPGDKCKGTKYGEICDDSPPSVGIKFPKHRDRLPAGLITIEVKATDGQTEVANVEVFVNGVSIGDATFSSGDRYTIDHLFTEKGRYVIKAIATDLVGNEGSDRIQFRIV